METLSTHLLLNRILSTFPTVSERYYEQKFYRNQFNPNCDQSVLLHSNRVCLITLSANHEIIKFEKRIKTIDFSIDEELNRLNNKVSGKWKKGGQKVSPESVLCRIECEDQSIYDIKACINGTIVEINHKLIDNNELLTEKTWSDGYIAIILPFRGHHESIKESLLSLEEYKHLLLTAF